MAASSRDGLVIVADSSKLVGAIGNGPLPVEVEPFLSRPDKRGANYWQRFRRIVVPMILIDSL